MPFVLNQGGTVKKILISKKLRRENVLNGLEDLEDLEVFLKVKNKSNEVKIGTRTLGVIPVS